MVNKRLGLIGDKKVENKNLFFRKNINIMDAISKIRIKLRVPREDKTEYIYRYPSVKDKSEL